MKKSIIAIVLAIATLATFIIPASAYDFSVFYSEDHFEVPSYDVAIVEEGTIIIDGKMEAAYTDSYKIVSDDTNIYRRPGYEAVWGDLKGSFFTYVVVDVNGMYIYAEIEDGTMFDELDTDPQSGDRFQIYFDWTPAEMMHPTPEKMYEDYLLDGTIWEPLVNPSPYLSTWGQSSYQYLGNISYDYRDNVRGVWGFGPVQALGINQDGMVETVTGEIKGGWKIETFIPWREDAQKESIAKGEQFHCSIGFQYSDDADMDDMVSPGKEVDAGGHYDRRADIGLNYWNCYSALSDLIWGEYPEGYFDASNGGVSEPGDVIDTSDAIIAVVASLAVAGAGVVLFSRKRKEEN